MLALFSFTAGPTTDVISEFAATFQLPVVSVAPAVDASSGRRRHRHRQRPTGSGARDSPGEILLHDEMTFAFHIRPLYTAAVVDIIRYYQWQHVVYVFDNADGTHNNIRVHSNGRVRIVGGPPSSCLQTLISE